MKVAKKGLSMLLALMMLFMLLPQMVLPARAEVTSGTCGDNLQWSLDSETGVLTITGTGDMWNWYSRNTDETFKMSPFAKKASIRSVILPDGLTRIGDNAFYFCSSLAGVTIPPSVTLSCLPFFLFCFGCSGSGSAGLSKESSSSSSFCLGEYFS